MSNPRTLLLSLPGLSRAGLAHLPAGTHLHRLATTRPVADLVPTWPAVTCSVQASLTTGATPTAHGIIANGLATYRGDAHLTDPANLTDYRRAVSFWEQSNQFLDVPRVWDGIGKKTALLFFQHSMPGFSGELKPAADIVITPKPEHGPDGKLTALLWSNPDTLAARLQRELGPFPLMHYWGPLANLKASEWIIAAAARVWEREQPDLQLTYIPHLDYDFQRFGPNSPQAAKAVAELALALDPLLEAAAGANILVLSEYAIDEVNHAIAPNRLLHDAGLLKLTAGPDGPQIDYLLSRAWVLCDHQIGHVFLRSPDDAPDALAVLQAARVQATGVQATGVEVILPKPIFHRRGGDIQVQAPKGAWLDYRWWSDPRDAPPWATSIDIHRKPGYDPLELFFDVLPSPHPPSAAPSPAAPPTAPAPLLPSGPPLAVSAPRIPPITTDSSRIRGSHGRTDQTPGILFGPSSVPPSLECTAVAQLLVPTLK